MHRFGCTWDGWGARGECAMPTCSLPRGTVRPGGQAELGPAAGSALFFA